MQCPFHGHIIFLFNDKAALRFLDISNDCALEKLVTGPTRRVVILVLVLSRSQDLVREGEVITPAGSSDHSAIKWSIKPRGHS